MWNVECGIWNCKSRGHFPSNPNYLEECFTTLDVNVSKGSDKCSDRDFTGLILLSEHRFKSESSWYSTMWNMKLQEWRTSSMQPISFGEVFYNIGCGCLKGSDKCSYSDFTGLILLSEHRLKSELSWCSTMWNMTLKKGKTSSKQSQSFGEMFYNIGQRLHWLNFFCPNIDSNLNHHGILQCGIWNCKSGGHLPSNPNHLEKCFTTLDMDVSKVRTNVQTAISLA